MDQTGKNIVILVTLDTKSEEAFYLQRLIMEKGHNALTMDIGISGETPAGQHGFTREEVARSAGRSSMEEVRTKSQGYADSLSTMAEGAKRLVENLIAEGRLDGLISIGGSLGNSQALKIMKELPFRIPKIAVSPVAFIGELINIEMVSVDQVMMQTVADLQGVNHITNMILERAAGAICGMVETQRTAHDEHKPLVAISALGVHDYVPNCKRALMKKGYELVVFHSVGTGALEKMIRQKYFRGVLDLSCYELVNHVCGGPVRGGKEKFVAACETKIPQVVSPGALDFFPWPVSWPVPAKFKKRRTISHADATLVKTTHSEQREIATLMSERLNNAQAPVAILVPMRGFSRLDRGEEAPFYDEGAGKKFSRILKNNLHNPLVETKEVDAHINDPLFAEIASEWLSHLLTDMAR
jgi:uncharacterized protein (UPF0261 family)